MNIVPVKSFSGRGELPPQFRARLTGLAIAADGQLRATGDREIKTFTIDGELISRAPTSDAAWSLCAAGDTLWIGMQGCFAQLDLKGRVVSRVDDRERLGLLTGIAATADHVLVADATNKVLRLYDRGIYVRDVGLDLNTRGFMLPNGVLSVAFDADKQQFVVAHPQKHRIERYELDGTPAGHFGRFGNADPADFGGCCNPNTIAVTPRGQVVVSEKAPPRVKIYSSAGELLAVTPAGAFAAEAKNMTIAFDNAGHMFATDPARLTIEAFQIIDET